MDREKLIGEVRKYPCLYDLSDSKYNDILKKDKAWRQISAAINRPESECKKTWLNLRESHRRTIKKRKAKRGQTATKMKKWTFEDEMSFLLPHYKERKKFSSVTDASGDDDRSDGSIFFNDESQNSTNEIQFPENERQETTEVPSRPKSSASSVSNTPKITKKNCEVENNLASHALMKYLFDEKKNKGDAEIDAFFNSIAATVKKFSEYNQAIIKKKIYNEVSEIELKEIADKQNYYGYDSSFIPQRPGDFMPRALNTLDDNQDNNKSETSPIRTQTDSKTDDLKNSNTNGITN